MKPHKCPFCAGNFKEPLKHIGKCTMAIIMLDPAMESELNKLKTGSFEGIIQDTMQKWSVLFTKQNGRGPSPKEYENMRAISVRNLKFIRGEET